MITIFIDNKTYQVKEGQNLLQACLSLGFDLPYFCWHPAMHSVGACRQCAVKQFKDDKDTRGRIVMSCMTPLAEGMRISVDDPEAKAFRSSITEFMMVNHPHDCPVCDEGGDCHLQDMTVMTGHTYRHTRFKKRTHRNQDLGPFINHEMNRCIACYRCVRYYRGYAGGRDLNVFASHDSVYFGRHEDGVLESEFSGNLVEICPTGVFTDKTFKKHYTRKWDLQTAPSICVHCGLGCNIIAGERYGTLRRVLNRYNYEVNGYFLCDRGRFGYEFVNSEKRIRKPLFKSPSLNPSHQGRDDKASSPLAGEDIRRGGHENLKSVSKESVLKRIAAILTNSRITVGIGSPRASLESNFALRTLVGPANFYSGMSSQEHKLTSLVIDILRNGPARTPSLKEVQNADAILVLGEDVTNTAPMLALALRQAARNKQFEIASNMKIPAWDDNAIRNAGQGQASPVFILSPGTTRLDDIAHKTVHVSSQEIALMANDIAREIGSTVPPLPSGEGSGVTGKSDVPPLVLEIAEALKKAKRPLIVSGTGCINDAVIESAANVAWALCASNKQASLCYTALECNTMGSGLLGGNNIVDIADQDIDTLIILENDLYRREKEQAVNNLLARSKSVIVLDHLMNTTASKADLILPAATFAESSGTLVNNEGRAQRFYEVFQPEGEIRAGWKWINDIMIAIGRVEGGTFDTLDRVTREMSSSLPLFAQLKDRGPFADFRIHGAKIPRQSRRYSGRTAMNANVNLHEPKPPDDPDTPLSYSMEGYEGQPPAPLITRYQTPGWNSVQALNKFQQETGGPLRGEDPGIKLISTCDKQNLPFFNSKADIVAVRSENTPEYQIFGSEELSSCSPSIVEMMPMRSTLENKP